MPSLRMPPGRSFEMRVEVGAIGVIVDATDDRARTFYEQYGLQRFQSNPYRLILFMRTVEQLVPQEPHAPEA